MALSSEEKRRFPRIELHVPLRYQVRGVSQFNNTLSENLSSQGISFRGSEFIAPGSTIMLEINLFHRCLRPIGRIAWSSPLSHSDRYRAGVEFLELDRTDKNYLTDYIDMQRGKL